MNFFSNILESDLDRFKSIFEIYNKLYNRNIEVIISRNTYDLIGNRILNDKYIGLYTSEQLNDDQYNICRRLYIRRNKLKNLIHIL